MYPEIMANPEDTSNGVGGLLHYFYILDEWAILPSLIFMGVGAMTDFGPLIANPKQLSAGCCCTASVSSQLTLWQCLWDSLIRQQQQSPSSAVLTARPPSSWQVSWTDRIHGTDRRSCIFLHVSGSDHSAADHEALTTEKERKIKMEQLRPVSKLEKILFPIIVTIVVVLILPTTAPLVWYADAW